MLARNSETFGKVPRWSVKLCLYFPPTYFYPGTFTCLSPLQLLDWLNLGHGLRLAEVCCKNTIHCGGGTSWYLSQSWILDFSPTPFHPPTWMPVSIALPCISVTSFTNDDDRDSQHFLFFSYPSKYLTNSRWFYLHNAIIIPISQMKKARLREITWFGQSHTASESHIEPESQVKLPTAHILAVPLYCLLMTGGGFFLFSSAFFF